MTEQKVRKLVFGGTVKITIDSGAAESVMLKGTRVNEPAVVGQTKKNRVKYVAANGAVKYAHGEPGREKRVRCQKIWGARCSTASPSRSQMLPSQTARCGQQDPRHGGYCCSQQKQCRILHTQRQGWG